MTVLKTIKNISIIILITLSATAVFAQSVKVPGSVQMAFEQKFPGVKAVHWGMENAHEYEAEFHMAGQAVSANFSKKGKWVETETDINRDQLPVVVVRKLGTYKGYAYGEIARTATPGKTIYEVELHKGNIYKTLIFNLNGKLMKTLTSGSSESD